MGKNPRIPLVEPKDLALYGHQPLQIRHPERRRSRNRRTPNPLTLPLLLAAFCPCTTPAQTAPASIALSTSVTPAPTKTFHDPTNHLSFDYPANWTFATSDHEISTFHLDARSAPPRAALRAVVASPENPFPASTFSGAYVYFSVTPHTSASACARQAAPPPKASHKPPAKPVHVRVGDIPFSHGHDEVKDICITQHDEIYTTRQQGACYRFDLSINNFCGGEVSGVKDITPHELDQVRTSLESILSTFRFEPR